MTETKAKRRWFRFSLRMLLAVVTAAAVGSWGYWIGWPWWQAYHDRVTFEEAAKQLKAGLTQRQQPWIPWNKVRDECLDQDLLVNIFKSPNVMYCVCYKLGFQENPTATARNQPCENVRVYRLSTPPKNYKSITLHAKQQQTAEASLMKPTQEQLSETGYLFDFLTAITDGQTEISGFPCELIYSDPPAKPIQ